MSFETEAELSLTLDEGDLKNVRQQIEDGIGATEVGVTDGGSMSAQSAASSGGGRGARRSMRLAESRNEYLSDSLLYLEDIEDHLSEGGFSGAGGLAAEILGIGGDFAAEGAGAAADTVTGLATDVAGAAIGQAAGSVIAQQLSGAAVDVEPNPLPVEGGGSGGGVTVSPTFNPTFTPDVGTEINLPDLNLGVPDTLAVDREPLPVEREPLAVEREPLAVEETTLQVEQPSWAPIQVVGPASQSIQTTRRAGGVEDPFRLIGERALAGGATGALTGAATGAIGGGVGAVPGAAIGAGLGVISGGAVGAGEVALRGGARNGPPPGRNRTPVTNDVDATVSPRITIDVNTDRLVREVGREFDEAMSDVRGELLDRIEDLEADLDELERDLRRGGR